ncbi:MAG: SulP family inorganic anion transporter [Betaproteobacteria bacterium]
MIALLEARRANLFARHSWAGNVVAGVIVGIVALPLAMAFAIASGARPEQGLYTAIIAGLCVSLLGGTRVQIAGPTGAFIAVLSGVTAKYGIEGLQIATIMAGAILVAMGLARLGAVIRFIPAPVIVGFTAGIGVIIFVGQWRDFLGLPKTGGEHFHSKLWNLVQAMPQMHWPTVALAVSSLLLVLYTPRIKGLKRLPGPLAAMVVATVLQSAFHFKGVATLGSAFGGIPFGLPRFALPNPSISEVITLLGPALAIALLGAIESLLSAVVADGMTGYKHDSNQELVGQGIANLLAPLFGGFAATGAIARTATNVRSGGTSPLAGTVHAATLIAVLLLLAPLASSIPLAALAAILFVVAWNMSDFKHFGHILQTAPAADKVILVVTFLLTVFADLVIAVNVGVLLAILQFLRRMTDAVETNQLDDRALLVDLHEMGLSRLPKDVLVYEIAGPIFFGAVESFERALLHTNSSPEMLIIRMRHVPFMDATGLQTFAEVVGKLRKRRVDVLLCEANPRVVQKLRNAGIFKLIGEENYAQDFQGALATGLAIRANGTPLPENLDGIARQMLEITRRYFESARGDRR